MLGLIVTLNFVSSLHGSRILSSHGWLVATRHIRPVSPRIVLIKLGTGCRRSTPKAHSLILVESQVVRIVFRLLDLDPYIVRVVVKQEPTDNREDEVAPKQDVRLDLQPISNVVPLRRRILMRHVLAQVEDPLLEDDLDEGDGVPDGCDGAED